MARVPRRRKTAFRAWLEGFGVGKLVAEFGQRGIPIRRRTVYVWLEGTSSPAFAQRRALVAISHGRITAEVVDRHREAVRATLCVAHS